MRKTIAVGCLALLLCTPACCKPGDASGVCRAEEAIATCAKSAGPAVFNDLLAVILPILADGEANWIAQIEALGGKYGVALVDCIVQHAGLLGRGSVPPGKHAAYLPAGLKISERARIWHATKRGGK